MIQAIKNKMESLKKNTASKFARLKQMKVKDCVFPVIIWSLLLVWCIMFLFLIAWGMLTSLKNIGDWINNPAGFPTKIYWGNFKVAIANLKAPVEMKSGGVRYAYLPEMFFNTVMFAMVIPYIALIVMETSTYAIVKYRAQFAWLGWLFNLSIFMNFCQLAPSLATTLKIQQTWGLYDNWMGQIIWNCGSIGGGMIMYYACIKSVAGTYAEAAFIDGAGHWGAYFHIVRPMISGIFWAMWFGKFINFWNNYMTPMIYLPSHPTISYAAWQVQFSSVTEFASIPAKLAGLTIVLIPIITVFLVFNKKIMNRQLTFGGLKG